ncbi:hypothetical protein PAHAL_4G267400 [Panicum hallii]|uniref:Uncharacterized protein n=1 Tax=Panicum hallii TaxID=206008 RepID=A0A2S3HKF7_9POAL|nr:uncharacterized protein LOC112889719 [Panicum hallii]PAN25010.1 hypothetical protein PAHAL_4G267400 [Panicum hallii]
MDAAGGGGAVVAGGGADEADAAFFSRRGHRCCGCFWAPPWAAASSPSQSPRARRAEPADEEWWHRVGDGAASGRRRWWRRGVDALMKVREWSELVAGPRWKTFIRRLRFRRGGPRHGAGSGKLNYDPLSYALNFDEGHAAAAGGGPEGGDYAGYLDFSARFVAPPPASAKSSMDLGGRDAPPLFLHQAHSPRTPPAAARG